MGVKVFLILLAIFLLFRKFGGVILRILLKAFLGRQIKKAQKQGYSFGGTDPFASQRRPTAKEGEIHVDNVPKKERGKYKPGSFKGGEYVDFEEVD
ncbi:hypothetical protein FUAX_03140 [Fulvitalea axinellae]|uniref:DUF4834 family protein n=1 Tax=Fulvitalea axinellae TaxID=1182444 RepID=A0AAU9CR78_9BACT|nr:hypothetical protein FUAX_03140 [Fulvitalea axinellae]